MDDHTLIQDEHQRRGALLLHALPVLFIPLIASMLSGALLVLTSGIPLPQPGADERPNPLLPIAVLVVFFSALIILVRLGRPRISALLLIAAWTLVTTLISIRSGVTSITPALLIVPICAAGLLIDRVASVSLAALATLLITYAGWLELRDMLPPFNSPPAVIKQNLPVLASGFWIGIFWTVALLTALLAGGLQRALAQSRAQATALSDLSAQLEARVAAQTERLLDQEREAAMLEERTRLAREIHDTLAQGLTGIVVQLGAAQRALEAAPDQAGGHLELAQRMARESLAEARRSVWNLRSPALERGDLGDALRGLAARPLRPETALVFEERGAARPLSLAVESALLRVAQEALVNVARHARATRATVLLEYLPGAVRLTVSDNGVGFEQLPAPPAPGPWGGFGLLGMRERISALGGRLDLLSDGGATVVAELSTE
ncbi:MAG TPA: sensor histidine kinase [Roseiflexaceae bacterium]|nr:sensor histidine kinase [Roseiflexaceae bacterium]